MSSSYEQIYEIPIPKLSKCDFFEVAKRLGLSLQPDGSLSVHFLDWEFSSYQCSNNIKHKYKIDDRSAG